jgi:hypothetical protein
VLNLRSVLVETIPNVAARKGNDTRVEMRSVPDRVLQFYCREREGKEPFYAGGRGGLAFVCHAGECAEQGVQKKSKSANFLMDVPIRDHRKNRW